MKNARIRAALCLASTIEMGGWEGLDARRPYASGKLAIRFVRDATRPIPIRTAMNITPALNQTPFLELMRHPEKLAAALQAAKRENDAFAASRIYSRNAAGHDRTATSEPPSQRRVRGLAGQIRER